jgi:Tol biopolymer transport system component
MNNINLKIGDLIFAFLLLVVLVGWMPQENKASKDDFPVLKGPYLGQKPPGCTAILFADGILDKDNNSFNTAFSPDGKEVFFTYIDIKSKADYQYIIKFSLCKNNIWQKPETAFFSGKYDDADVTFSPDGNMVFFCSDRPHPKSADMDIWYIKKGVAGWSNPIYAGTEVNTIHNEVHAALTKKNNLFFASNRPGGIGDKDLYAARYKKGKFTQVKNLGPNINSKYLDSDCFVDPDEAYLLFDSLRQNGFGKVDIYVSFKTEQNTWSKAINLGKNVNTKGNDSAPIVSPDGKYLFFFRFRKDQDCGLYWISTEVIHKLKNKTFL